jgi:hypothetical protein
MWGCFYHQTIFLSSEAIMRPKTIVESKWSLLLSCGVDDYRLVANHAHANLAALFSIIEGPYSYSDFDTHFNYNKQTMPQGIKPLKAGPPYKPTPERLLRD